MNKNIIKVLAVVLMFALIIPFAVSCKDDTPQPVTRPTNNPASSGAQNGDPNATVEERIYPEIPESDFEG